MAAYRQRERDALLASMADKEREVMLKPRGFNGCYIAAITSIDTAEHREREVCEEREREVREERENKREVCEEREGGP
ncbi:hypothetical protein AMTRI_Chr02g258280 [Amborella trichopoda]